MRAGLAAILIALAATAQAAPMEESPRPQARPDALAGSLAPLLPPGRAATAQPRADVLAQMVPAVPVAAGVMPRGDARLAGVRPVPRPAQPEAVLRVAAAPAPRLAAPGKLAKGSVCGIPGLTGHPIPAISSRVAGCGLADGVEITHVSGIPLSLPAQVDCGTAAALKSWVDGGILPAVGNRGGGVAQLQIAGSYACRPRNNQKGSQVSEHGRGRAVDLSGIRLRSGEVITVAQGWGSRAGGPILERIHRAACGPFGTVLGPRSDRFHQDHIHVDTARNRGGAYCR